MAIKGMITAECPAGCEPVEAEVWSFVRGDVDEALRESLLAGDLNLLVCEDCGTVFMPKASVVYFDPEEDLLAFIFPESYRKEEARWREKMHVDFEEMKGVIGGSKPPSEPIIYFGMEEAAQGMQAERDLEDEVRIAAALASELGLSIYPVDRSYARGRGLPRVLPCSAAPEGKDPTREDALKGLLVLLKANDRLAGFRRWLPHLGKVEGLPPRARGKS